MKNYLKLVNVFAFAFILLFSLSTCSKEELGNSGLPRIRTVVVESISDTGAVFRGEIIDIPKDCEVIDHGFVWSDSKEMTNYLEKVSLGSTSSKGPFNAGINRVMVEGRKYYFKAFIQTTKDIIFGNELEFISLGAYTPVISSIYPESAGWLDTVIVRGKYFSNSYRMDVYFDDYPAKNCVNTDSMLKVLVPQHLNSLNTKVSIRFANVNYPGKEFHLVPNLKITSLEPSSAWWNSVIKVKGKLLQITEDIYFDSIKATIKSRTDSMMEVIVPPTLPFGSAEISIDANKFHFTSPAKFKLLPVEINSVVPSTATWNKAVKITGKHLALTEKVTFGGIPAKIKSKSDSIVEVLVPYHLTETHPDVNLIINNTEFKASQPFILIPGKNLIAPATGTIATDVTIKVNSISPVTKVRVGTIDVPIRSKTDTSVTVHLPEFSASGRISFTLSDGTNEVLYKDVFDFWKAEVTSQEPSMVSYGDTLTLTGNNLQGCQSIVVGSQSVVFTPGNTCIKFPVLAKVFTKAGSQSFSMIYPNQRITRTILIRQPVITAISPTTIKNNDIVTVTAENLCPDFQMSPSVNGVPLKVISSSRTGFQMKVENALSASGYLSVKVGENVVSNTNIPITISSAWRRVTTHTQNHPVSLTGMNGFLYLIDGGDYPAALKINPQTGGKTSLPTYPTEFYVAGIKTFVYNNQLYAGLGHIPDYSDHVSNNLYRLNETLRKWESVTTLPGTYFESRAGFYINGKFYFITIQSNKTFSKTKVFNLADNQWSEIDPFPFTFSQKSARSAVVNNIAYLFTANEAYKFDPSDNSWTVLQKPPVTTASAAVTVFNVGSRIYYFADQKLYEYSISGNNFVKRSDYMPVKRIYYYTEDDYFEVSASLDQKGYVGFGAENPSLYEYDPALEP